MTSSTPRNIFWTRCHRTRRTISDTPSADRSSRTRRFSSGRRSGAAIAFHRNINVAVPSAEERAGDFTDQCSSPDGFCPNVGPDLIAAGYNPNDPTVQALLGMIPLPTTGTGLDSRYRTSLSLPTNWREELIRVDHNFTDKIRGTVRYIHDSWDTVTDVPSVDQCRQFPHDSDCV